MTTIAWDGTSLAYDTLRTDGWGLKEYEPCKVMEGKDFLLGGAGDLACILRYQKRVAEMTAAEILDMGFPDYKKDQNDPSLLLVTKSGVFTHGAGMWLRVSRPFHAIGSGRDYALMAMYLGKTAQEAVALTEVFDNDTKAPVITRRLSE